MLTIPAEQFLYYLTMLGLAVKLNK